MAIPTAYASASVVSAAKAELQEFETRYSFWAQHLTPSDEGMLRHLRRLARTQALARVRLDLARATVRWSK